MSKFLFYLVSISICTTLFSQSYKDEFNKFKKGQEDEFNKFELEQQKKYENFVKAKEKEFKNFEKKAKNEYEISVKKAEEKFPKAEEAKKEYKQSSKGEKANPFKTTTYTKDRFIQDINNNIIPEVSKNSNICLERKYEDEGYDNYYRRRDSFRNMCRSQLITQYIINYANAISKQISAFSYSIKSAYTLTFFAPEIKTRVETRKVSVQGKIFKEKREDLIMECCISKGNLINAIKGKNGVISKIDFFK